MVEIATLESNDTPGEIENCIKDHVNKVESINEAVGVINVPQILEEITETTEIEALKSNDTVEVIENCNTTELREDVHMNEATEKNKPDINILETNEATIDLSNAELNGDVDLIEVAEAS